MIAALIGGAVGVVVDLVAPWAAVGGIAGVALAGLGLLVGGPGRRLMLALAAGAIVTVVLVLTIAQGRENARVAAAERDAARQALQEAERVQRANLAALDQLRRRHDADLASLATALDRTRAAGRRAERMREEVARDHDAKDPVAPAIARYLDRLRVDAPRAAPTHRDPDREATPAAGPDALRGGAGAAAGPDRPGEPSDVDRRRSARGR